jgi:hypothetical protein
MNPANIFLKHWFSILGLAILFALPACGSDDDDSSDDDLVTAEAAALLVIDKQSIDNGNPPNYFPEVDVNDQLAEVGQRRRWLRPNQVV